MSKTKPVTAKNQKTLARVLGLSGVESEGWKVQHALPTRPRRIVRDEALTQVEVARRGGSSRTRVTSIRNGNPDRVSSSLPIRLLGQTIG